MDGDDGVVPVAFSSQHAFEFGRLEVFLHLVYFGRDFLQSLLVILFPGQLEVPFGFLHLGLQLLPEFDSKPQRSPLLEDLLRSFVVVPEVGFEGFLLDLGKAGDLGV